MDIDLVVEDARIHTQDNERPWATRMAVLHGRVIGLDSDVDGMRPHQRVRLDGATVLPGFNDAHCHPVSLGATLDELDLSQQACRDVEDIYRLVAERAREIPAGSWIIGAGYDQNKLGHHPTRAGLDSAAPNHYVWLKHVSAHMCVVNSQVLKTIGVFSGAAVVPRGGIVRAETGLIEEQAQLLVRNLILPLSEEQVASALGRASELALRQGVTSWTDAGVGSGWVGHSMRELGGYLLARKSGRLGVRTTAMVSMDCLHPVDRNARDTGSSGLDLGIRTGFGDDWLRIGAVKVFSDGSLIGRTAAMCCDYADEPGNTGYLQDDEQQLHERIVDAHLAGWQVAIHAIGDRAVDVVLDAIAEAQALQRRPDARHRIEHAGVTSSTQLARLAELSIIPVPQGELINTHGDGMAAALGPNRLFQLYRQRSFLDAGLVLPGSSDRPVVPGAPLTGIRDLVLRTTASGRVLAPEERLTVADALRCWTVGSAFAEHAEDRKGTLVPGMLADFVVLAEDPYIISPERIANIDVLATYIDGECRYRS